MVFLIIEKIKGSPASPAVQIGAMWVGLVLIGCVFILVTYNDIYRLVRADTSGESYGNRGPENSQPRDTRSAIM